MIRCPSCDEDDVRVTSAGSNWLVECLNFNCYFYWHISDDELKASA